VVRYVNDFGEDEAGIDIGGLFKDFWTDLSARVFNPSFGLFAVTESQVRIPDPSLLWLCDLIPSPPLSYFTQIRIPLHSLMKLNLTQLMSSSEGSLVKYASILPSPPFSSI
jgi:hypothetical protein